jgi:ketosteroid isomerase-like protein
VEVFDLETEPSNLERSNAASRRTHHDTAYEGGEATLTHRGGTASVKFVVVWRMVDGQWRLHRDIWNSKGA